MTGPLSMKAWGATLDPEGKSGVSLQDLLTYTKLRTYSVPLMPLYRLYILYLLDCTPCLAPCTDRRCPSLPQSRFVETGDDRNSLRPGRKGAPFGTLSPPGLFPPTLRATYSLPAHTTPNPKPQTLIHTPYSISISHSLLACLLLSLAV